MSLINSEEIKKEAYRLTHDIESFPEFCERFLRIIPREGGKAIPLVLNKIQIWFHNTYVVPPYKAGLPVRVVILKMRQAGFSTYCQALLYWHAIGGKFRKSLVVASKHVQSEAIFQVFKRFHDNVPENNVLPDFPIHRETKNLMHFHNPKYFRKHDRKNKFLPPQILDSSIETRSAEDRENLGRGETFHAVHLSEVAFWPDLIPAMTALMACCHPEPQTLMFVETTANGYNAFYNFWSYLSLDGKDVGSEWQKAFIPWYWDDNYQADSNLTNIKPVDEEEDKLVDLLRSDEIFPLISGHQVTDEEIRDKILWRRRAIVDKSFGDLDQFKQEYPVTSFEAFRFSGLNVFSTYRLGLMEREIREPVWRGDVFFNPEKEDGDKAPSLVDPRKPNVLELLPTERGRLRVYQQPEPKSMYIIAADVAEGKAVEGIDENKSKYDYSCAQIFKVSLEGPVLQQVAIWHGSEDPDLFGRVLVALAMMYNEAFLSWEINGPGRSLKIQIVDICRYKNIYMRQEMDSISHRTTMKPGWVTNTKTKPLQVSVARGYVRSGEVLIHDEATLAEFKTFSQIDGKYLAATGHDDRTMAFCQLCTVADEHLIRIRKTAIKRREKDKETPESLFLKSRKRKNRKLHPRLGKVF